MYSKTISITTTALDTHQVQSGTIPIYFSPSGVVGGSSPYYSYPKAMQFKNGTGQLVKIGFIDNDEQLAEYHADSTNFDLMSVDNGDIWYANNLFPFPRFKYLLVQCPTGSTTAALDVDFMLFSKK